MRTFIKEFPTYKKFFNFQQFNDVQLKCYKPLINDKRNMVVSAPTSSGKTVIFQLAIINQMKNDDIKCLYLAPIKSLCHQKSTNWHSKFREKLKIFQLTSDTSAQQQNAQDLQQINLVIATPQKIDAFSRKSLSYLSKINLLLVDQVHMLNFQERGATLEAVVSRIMSINNPRIIAVSATIPNIKQVAEWLRVPDEMTFLFNEQYRPVKLHKVVLGFKSSNNPYTFEKILNYKLTEVIRSYSQEKGVLVFCQTQKGTQMACQQVISDMKQREFIDSDQTLMALIKGSKAVSNTTLQIMIPQGVAFHNAGLSMQDRSIVEKLFLQNHLRILCTTSTLAMGINLPARLVVIKSTQCYRGSGKGYQQYTQIEMDQMMGRAGRPPFDNQGTVVIMTQKQNYNKYLNSGKLQLLESHLYGQLCEHINAQISLKSIKCLKDILKYFMNSFCYVRMKNSPGSYGIKDKLQNHVQKICLQSITKLNTYNFINYSASNQSITPRQLGINVARNSIEIETIITIIKQITKIKSQRDFLGILCESQEVKKYRNKLDQRKLLKQLNDKNKYVIKQAISNPQKKCYVLLQCQLDGRHIENWQLRKQSKDMIYFLRRLTYCVKAACYDLKLFWPYFWSCVSNKNFTQRFWERNQQMIIKQFPELNDKWKMLSAKGFKNIDHIMNNLQHLDTICQKNSQFSQIISRKIQNFRESITIWLTKPQTQRYQNEQLQFINQNAQNSQQEPNIYEGRNYIGNKDVLVKIKFNGFFDESFKSILIIAGQGNELYTIRTIKQECKQTTIAISSLKNYNIAVLKNNYIGFDQFYQIIGGRSIKRVDNVSSFIDIESTDRLNKGNKQKQKQKQKDRQQKQKYRSQQKSNRKTSMQKLLSNKIKNHMDGEHKQRKLKKKIKSNQWISVKNQQKLTQSQQQTRPKKKLIRFSNENNIKLKSRKKPAEVLDHSQQDLTIRPGTYIPLDQYKCWKPGFRKFQQPTENRLTLNKNLRIVDQDSSRSKASLQLNSLPTVKSKSQIHWQRYAYKEAPLNERQEKNSKNLSNKVEKIAPMTSSNPYEYFMNLFDK